MKALFARFRRVRVTASEALINRAMKDGDLEAAAVWAARWRRWTLAMEQKDHKTAEKDAGEQTPQRMSNMLLHRG
jgi:hypothetical protein